jgi:hypothetical protein
MVYIVEEKRLLYVFSLTTHYSPLIKQLNHAFTQLMSVTLQTDENQLCK